MFMDEDDKRLEALTQQAFLIPYKCNNKFSIQTILSLQKLHNITLKNMHIRGSVITALENKLC